MVLKLTFIAKIYNFSGQRVEARQLQANGTAMIEVGKTATVNWPIPWVTCQQDMDSQHPHLIRIDLLGNQNYILIWQHDDMIMQGLNYTHFAPTAPHPYVGGWKDLVLGKSNVELHNAGMTQYNVGPVVGFSYGSTS